MSVIGVIASGRGSNLQAIFDAIDAKTLSVQVGVVMSDKKDAEALARAQIRQIPTVFLDPKAYPDRPSYDTAVVHVLLEHCVQFVVLAGYMRIVTKALLDPFPNKVINIHPSLLPSFPGMHAQRQALVAGVKISGCTVHFVDEAVDHGPIISQAAVPVLDGDTEQSLTARILVEEHRLLPMAISLYTSSQIKSIQNGKKERFML
ncbi:MAG: phosphoribosylglycinamide formyltransferase [Nitrospirota bacterium]